MDFRFNLNNSEGLLGGEFSVLCVALRFNQSFHMPLVFFPCDVCMLWSTSNFFPSMYFISSSTCSYLEADLPYTTGETTLQKEFSNFGKIAEGKCIFSVFIL